MHEERVAIADIMKAADEGKLEEVFGTGTAAVVSPVKELDWEGKVAHISGGKIGELTQKLYDTLTGIQWGKLPGRIIHIQKQSKETFLRLRFTMPQALFL